MANFGKCIIFSAPSGSGKSTIVQWLMDWHPELHLVFSISATSRAPRGTEKHGEDYLFLSPQEFKQRVVQGDFLEYEEVYADHFYGTLKAQVELLLQEGQNVVFDVDVKGGCRIKEYFGGRALSIFIKPPSVEELRRRLLNRGTDDVDQIEKRIARADYEMSFAKNYDFVVVNDCLESAKQQTLDLIRDFLKPSHL